MPVDPVLKYLKDTELAFGSLSSGYIERYEEEILTPERVNLNHKHLPDKVLAANRPSVLEVLKEVKRLLKPPQKR